MRFVYFSFCSGEGRQEPVPVEMPEEWWKVLVSCGVSGNSGRLDSSFCQWESASEPGEIFTLSLPLQVTMCP